MNEGNVNPALACRRRFTGSRGTSRVFEENAPVKCMALDADCGWKTVVRTTSALHRPIRNPQSEIRNPVTDLAESGAGVTKSGSSVARNV
jgi:hypothetical protein